MPSFLLRRLIHGVFVVWGVVTAVFFLVRLTGDPSAFLVDQSATREEIAHTRHLLGLDRPLYEQYAAFLLAAPRGDFGTSIRDKRPAMGLVLEHLWPATVELALAAALLSTVLAVPLGIISATHKDRAADHVSRIASLLLQSMPGFWLGLLLILLFAVELRGFLPAFGSGTWRHLVLPAVALAAAPSPRTRGWCGPACSRFSSRTTCAPPAPRVSPSAGSSTATRSRTPPSLSSRSAA